MVFPNDDHPDHPPPTRLPTAALPDVEVDDNQSLSPWPLVDGIYDQSGLGVVDSRTDAAYDDLTLLQVHERNEAARLESMSDGPLIGEIASLDELRMEYLSNTNKRFVEQIDHLSREGYEIRRTRGDGSCFYRSMAFAYVERLLGHPKRAGDALETLDDLQSQIISRQLYPGPEEYYDPLRTLIQSIKTDETGPNFTPKLLRIFQSDDSQWIVFFFRLLTSMRIRDDESLWAYLAQDGPSKFCAEQVELPGVEADHVQAEALCRALRLNAQIANLDGAGQDGDPVTFTYLGEGNNNEPLITLLFRPGHYDLLVKRPTLVKNQ